MALDAVRDPTLVAPSIARTLGLADNRSAERSRPRSPTEIGDRRVLLVLDNFEQVIGGGTGCRRPAAALPERDDALSRRASRSASRVSRSTRCRACLRRPTRSRLSEVERLNLPRALREFDLEALNQFEAVRLFIARATAVRPGFAVTNANAPAVAGIAARLHGMPLAIELAAARVKLLTPDQILARLEHHLDAADGRFARPARSANRRCAARSPGATTCSTTGHGGSSIGCRCSAAASTWRWPRRCAGRRTRSAATSSSASASSSTRASSVSTRRPTNRASRCWRPSASTPPRCSQARGEADAIAARHAAAMLELAERAAPHLSGADQRAWLERLEREHDNLRAALDWATARPDPTLGGTPGVRAVALLAAARLPQRGARPVRGDGGAGLGPRAGRPRQVRGGRSVASPTGSRTDGASTRWYQEALDVWRELGDKGEIANALYNRSYADAASSHARRPGDAEASGRAGRARGGAGALPRDRRYGRRGQHPVGPRQLLLLHVPTRRRPRTGTARPSSCIARPATGRWRRGRCTCSACRSTGQQHFEGGDRLGPSRPSALLRGRRCVGRHPRSSTTWRSIAIGRRGPRAGQAGCGARPATSSGRRARSLPATSSRHYELFGAVDPAHRSSSAEELERPGRRRGGDGPRRGRGVRP